MGEIWEWHGFGGGLGWEYYRATAGRDGPDGLTELVRCRMLT